MLIQGLKQHGKVLLFMVLAVIMLIVAFVYSSPLEFFGITWIFPLSSRLIAVGPLVQLIGDNRAMILWETPMMADASELRVKDGAFQVSPLVIQRRKGWLRKLVIYRAYVSNLRPGQTVHYNITSQKGNTYSYNSFRIPSAPTETAPLRVAVIGDNQYGRKKFTKLLKLVARSMPDVFLHLGDMVHNREPVSEWRKDLFKPLKAANILGNVPLFVTMGNHDTDGIMYPESFAPMSELPSPKLGYFYAQTIGNVRFLILDSAQETPAQVEWFKAELKSKETREATFRIVSVHIPPYIEYWEPVGWKKGEYHWPLYVRNNFVPLFEENNVDLVLSGHQHNYARGTQKGVTYVIGGGGGGDLDREKVEEFGMYQKIVIDHHWISLTVDPTSIKVEMFLIDGHLGDSFTINR